jgi:cbb3-type cytochrome oxidase maturation protein
MEILYILIPVSLMLVAIAIWLFGWAIKNGQYDDLEGPGHSILFDDDEHMIPGPDDKPKQQSKAPQHNQEKDV